MQDAYRLHYSFTIANNIDTFLFQHGHVCWADTIKTSLNIMRKQSFFEAFKKKELA